MKATESNVLVGNKKKFNWQMNGSMWRYFHSLKYLIQGLTCKYEDLVCCLRCCIDSKFPFKKKCYSISVSEIFDS